jgi:Tfp pilus assembly protein PilP
MRRTLILMALAVPALSACGGGSDADSKVTETRMDDIDSVEGTISDEMIPTDENAEQAPIDATPPPTAKPKSGGKENKADKDEAKPEPKPEPKAAEPAEAE